MIKPDTQHRIMARLIGAIYAIANALFPVIDKIVRQPNRPWQQNASVAKRFSHIIQQLLALTARVCPTTLSRTPNLPATPKRPAPALPADRPTAARPLPAQSLNPARPLSARQFARRLDHLLRQLEQLAAEIGAILPATIRRHIDQARTLAGCHAPPPKPYPAWESAG